MLPGEHVGRFPRTGASYFLESAISVHTSVFPKDGVLCDVGQGSEEW